MSTVTTDIEPPGQSRRTVTISFTSRKTPQSGAWLWRTEGEGWDWEHTMTGYVVDPPDPPLTPVEDRSIWDGFSGMSDECDAIADKEAKA